MRLSSETSIIFFAAPLSMIRISITCFDAPLEEQVEPCDVSTELGPPSEPDFIKNRNGNARSQVPRFMRSTVCSRTKTAMEHLNSLHSSRRRRRQSQRAESVSFPVKNRSECNSDHSISRSTCAVELNRKTSNGLDSVTVYSQDTSECDIKMVRHMEKNGSRKLNKCKSTEVLKVDEWLTLHKDEPSASNNKGVLDIPLPGKKHRLNGEKKVFTYESTMRRNGNKKQKQSALEVAGPAGSSVSQRVEDKPPTLKDLFTEEASSKMCQTIDHQDDSLDGSLIDDSEGDSLSLPDSLCDGLEQFDYEDEFYGTPMVQAVDDTTSQCSNSSMIKIISSRYHKFSPFDLEDSMSNSQEYFGVPEETSEPEQYHKQAMATEPCVNKDMDASSQSPPKDITQKDLSGMILVKSQEVEKKEGACCILKQKVEKSWATALLGLGFLDLGLNHDFFYGLIL